MKNILIIGALPETQEQKDLYEKITETALEFSDRFKSPSDTAKFHGTNKERYERAFETVKEADLVIAESSNPSTGQGMEIRECAIQNKPVIVIAKVDSKVSGLLKGCPVVKKIIFYKSIEDLRIRLKGALNYLANSE